MKILQIDHLVLTVQDIPRTCEFYSRVLGMQVVTFGNPASGTQRQALQFGQQKLNLHQAGQEFEPKALRPTPGAIDLCLISETPLAEVQRHLQACGVAIESGIVPRTGAMGAIASLYIRDPDGNLIEISNRIDPQP
ncbi:MAG: VOC family protein [Oculatellaceae cyanobacterium Prado106]|jgi:catechol 2,3-dioxygenase-like lactoylglutathione lyase family enzyme|nr:VOC family protein [Oculatellaceae cyanobacterium Prado106]